MIHVAGCVMYRHIQISVYCLNTRISLTGISCDVVKIVVVWRFVRETKSVFSVYNLK